jgi:copper chaperone
MITTKEFLAADMSCGHCKMAVESAVKKLGGIQSVNAELGTKKVVVEYDESDTTVHDIMNAIEESGYKAVELADEIS